MADAGAGAGARAEVGHDHVDNVEMACDVFLTLAKRELSPFNTLQTTGFVLYLYEIESNPDILPIDEKLLLNAVTKLKKRHREGRLARLKISNIDIEYAFRILQFLARNQPLTSGVFDITEIAKRIHRKSKLLIESIFTYPKSTNTHYIRIQLPFLDRDRDIILEIYNGTISQYYLVGLGLDLKSDVFKTLSDTYIAAWVEENCYRG